MPDTTSLQKQLIGDLIGLARATDGNEHLIIPSSTAVMVKALAALDADSSALERLIRQVEEEKRKLVPDCFLCACPCGRTDAYDLTRLETLDTPAREQKYDLLQRIRDLAAAQPDDETQRSFYKALIAIGMEEIDPAILSNILSELKD